MRTSKQSKQIAKKRPKNPKSRLNPKKSQQSPQSQKSLKSQKSQKPIKSQKSLKPIKSKKSQKPIKTLKKSSQKEKKDKDNVLCVVGIGASAGGLEALELFLPKIAVDSNAAYLIIQHQDPAHKSLMVDLLQSFSKIPIQLIENQMKIAPNNIYFIPPGKDLSLEKNTLILKEPNVIRGLRLPIDHCFRSLSEQKGEQAIGVVLSGMGSDGTLGLRAIKEKGGAAFVQDPITAKFDSMPMSVINEGLADVIAPAQELPNKIYKYLHSVTCRTEDIPLDSNQLNIEKIIKLIRTETGHDFSFYKKNTLYRRIERRISLYQLGSMKEYVEYLFKHRQEISLLFKELLIGVTRFFRDINVWNEMKSEVFPQLFAKYPNGSILRAWVPGCSTGEEAYTLAMIFKEAIEAIRESHKNFSLQIFATDLDKDNIVKARAGFFPLNIATDISEKRLRRFFVEEDHGYRINKDIREMVIFAPQNVIMDPPFTKQDILSCRNLLIYFESELQKKLLNLFHYSLNPGGILMLGTAETVGNANYLFAPLPGKARLYRRLETSRPLENIEFPTSFPQNSHIPLPPQVKQQSYPPNPKELVESILLQIYSQSAVLVTEQGDILYIHGKTGKFLEPSVGKASLNLFAMARNGLKPALSENFQKSIRLKVNVHLKTIRIKYNSHFIAVDVTIHPLLEHKDFAGMILVIFNEVELPKETKLIKEIHGKSESERIQSLLEELQYCQRTLQSTREEMQTSQEELRSANEELQSTNEELQSTNEELTTSKEEMQSMNEELQTINNELQAKIEELSRTSNDMHNLLNSTNIAILLLDENLKVRRFTNKLTNIFKLIPNDIGRKITDIVSELEYPTLVEDAKEVIKTLIIKEREVKTKDKLYYIVRIMPYRTLENKIDGVVITFTDFTATKKLRQQFQNSNQKKRNKLISGNKEEPSGS